MSDPYPFSTVEIVTTFLTEVGKEIPVLKSVIGATESVFAAIERKRIRGVLDSLVRRIANLEDVLREPKKAAVLIYGCDQARHDILCESKAEEYSGAIGSMMANDVALDEVMEVLDNLRKLSANDLKVLYTFRVGNELLPSRRVDEIAGITRYHEMGMEYHKIREKAEEIFPHLMRLQGLGVIYVRPATSDGRIVGFHPPDIGPLTSFLRQFAYLTDSGRRLVRVLPK